MSGTGSDILTLQAELAQAIAEQVHVHVTPQEHVALARRPVSLEAQDLYLKGTVQLANQGYGADAEEHRILQPGNRQGTRLRIGFCGSGGCLRRNFLSAGRKDYESRACEAARKALELDDSLGEAHASMDGCVDLWDWSQRERHLRRAIELSPSYPTAHQWLGAILIDLGRDREGLAEVRRAVELDPLGPSPNNALCMSLYMTRQYDQAIQHCLQVLEVFPGYLEPYFGLGFAYIAKGMYPQAIAYLEKAMTMTSGAPPVATLLAHARTLGGRSQHRHAAASGVYRTHGHHPDLSRLRSTWMSATRTTPSNIWTRPYKRARSPAIGSTLIPALDSLHSDPRWAALIRKMNLPN